MCVLENQVQLLLILEGVVQLDYVRVTDSFENRSLGDGLLDNPLVDYDGSLLKLLLCVEPTTGLVTNQKYRAEPEDIISGQSPLMGQGITHAPFPKHFKGSKSSAVTFFRDGEASLEVEAESASLET